VKINLTAKPARLEDLERSIEACDRVIGALDRDRENRVAIDEEAYREEVAKKEGLVKAAEDLRALWLKEKEAAARVVEIREKLNAAVKDNGGAERGALEKELDEATQALKDIQGASPMIQIEVDPDVVAQVVSDWTGIPLGKVLKDEAKNIIDLEDRLKERIKGQNAAISTLADPYAPRRRASRIPISPWVSFFSSAPAVRASGDGTCPCRPALGSDRNDVTINMSEFQESHTVSRLIGSPPGYVGYGEGACSPRRCARNRTASSSSTRWKRPTRTS
jgi:type VI secretion system protein VasG